MSPLSVEQWLAMSRAEHGQSTVGAATARPIASAEWQCTECGVTNRRLVPVGAREATDRCVHCGRKHRLRIDARPVRWNAEAA